MKIGRHHKSVQQNVDKQYHARSPSISVYLKKKNSARDHFKTQHSESKINKMEAFYEALQHKKASVFNLEYRYQQTFDILFSKINLLNTYAQSLQQKIGFVKATFLEFYKAYSQQVVHKNTANLLQRCKKQFEQLQNRTKNKTKHMEQIQNQFNAVEYQFKQLVMGYEKKIKQEKQKVKQKLQDQYNDQSNKMKSTIEALSYNNLILSKINNKPENGQQKIQQQKFQKLKAKHTQLVEQNDKYKLNLPDKLDQKIVKIKNTQNRQR